MKYRKKVFGILMLCLIILVFKGVIGNAKEEISINETQNLEKMASRTYVYTPRGTKVGVLNNNEMSQEKIETTNFMYDEWFPNAKRIAPASLLYNCHSYAWYRQSADNKYWMDDPSPYWEDGSYVETTNPVVGDIIFYFGPNSVHHVDEFPYHSGVIIGISSTISNNVCGDANKYLVRSKWGDGGIYEHRGDECPYTSPYQFFPENGYATSVRYYHHFHEFNKVKWVDRLKHVKTCYCGYGVSEAHAVRKNSNTCIKCGGPADTGFIEITSLTQIKSVTKNGSYILPNGVIVLVDADIESYLKGTLSFVQNNLYLNLVI